MGIKLWNQLSESTKSIRNIENSKTRVKLELLQGKLNFPE